MRTQGRPSPGPRRRTVLAWAAGLGPLLAAAALGGCADTVPATDDRAARARAALRATAAADSVAQLARYDATAAAHPGLAARLDPLRSQVALHAQAFGTAPAAPSTSATPSAVPSGSARPSAPPAPAVPASPKAALAALADAEGRLADARTAALIAAPPDLARLLASVAACGACHVLLLRGGA